MTAKMCWFSAMAIVATGEAFAEFIAKNSSFFSGLGCATLFGMIAFSVIRGSKSKGRAK